MFMKNQMPADSLSINLRHLSQLTGMKAEQIAKKSGLSQRAIAYYLSGERSPKVKDAELIAEVFGLRGWHLIMPDLPNDLRKSKALQRLIENYINSDDEGADMIEKVAEREAKYGGNK